MNIIVDRTVVNGNAIDVEFVGIISLNAVELLVLVEFELIFVTIVAIVDTNTAVLPILLVVAIVVRNVEMIGFNVVVTMGIIAAATVVVDVVLNTEGDIGANGYTGHGFSIGGPSIDSKT